MSSFRTLCLRMTSLRAVGLWLVVGLTCLIGAEYTAGQDSIPQMRADFADGILAAHARLTGSLAADLSELTPDELAAAYGDVQAHTNEAVGRRVMACHFAAAAVVLAAFCGAMACVSIARTLAARHASAAGMVAEPTLRLIARPAA